MKTKAKINYVVDLIIGLAFIATAVLGLVLFFAGASGGYQGGRNPGYDKSILFLSRYVWKDLHTWSSITMTVGVLGHFILHWNWMVCMTRNLFRQAKLSGKKIEASPVAACPIDG
jgi:hypothetical protein